MLRTLNRNVWNQGHLDRNNINLHVSCHGRLKFDILERMITKSKQISSYDQDTVLEKVMAVKDMVKVQKTFRAF